MIPPSVTLKGIWAALIALAFAILVALLVVQTVRLEGFKFWPIKIEGWIAKSERFERLANDCIAAGEANTAAQKAQKAAYEAKYKELATNADEQVERASADAMAAADRYIRANRVQRNQGGISTAPAATGDSGAGVPESVPSGVIVAESDVRTCTALYTYAVGAHDWAKGLIAD